MVKNLSIEKILLLVLAIVVIIVLLNWLFSPTVQPFQPVLLPPMPPSPNSFQVPDNFPNYLDKQDLPFILYYFYNPNCPHCKRFTPAWNELSDGLQGNDKVAPRAVDSTNPENENLVFYYNITRFPTIILITPNKNIEYVGNRSVDDLQKFLSENTQA